MRFDSIKKLKEEAFRRLTGVQRSTFEEMVALLFAAKRAQKAAGGKPNSLSIEDQLLMMLEYWRDMGRLRQGLIATRVAVSVIALYALVLQAFVARAALGVPFGSPDGAYARHGSQPEKSISDNSHRHVLCSVWACVECDCSYVAPTPGAVFFRYVGFRLLSEL
jgi:hypothetical protein